MDHKIFQLIEQQYFSHFHFAQLMQQSDLLEWLKLNLQIFFFFFFFYKKMGPSLYFWKSA